jgi:DNA-binding XRE family transcriptional regulator
VIQRRDDPRERRRRHLAHRCHGRLILSGAPLATGCAHAHARDLTQDDLAGQVDCSVVTIQKIDADARQPSRQITERLADSLRIAPISAQRSSHWRVPSRTSNPQLSN